MHFQLIPNDGVARDICYVTGASGSIPNDGVARDICYVTGASGSGKSYFTKQYADQYRKIYPKR